MHELEKADKQASEQRLRYRGEGLGGQLEGWSNGKPTPKGLDDSTGPNRLAPVYGFWVRGL